MSLHLEPIPSTGTRRDDAVRTFGHVATDAPVYPAPCPEAVALRRLRESHGWALRRAATGMGLLPSQLADLERGRARPSTPTTWDDVLGALLQAVQP